MLGGDVISIPEVRAFVNANPTLHAVFFPNCNGKRRLQVTLGGKKVSMEWTGHLRMVAPGFTTAMRGFEVDQLLVWSICIQRWNKMLASQTTMGLYMLMHNLR